VDENLIFDLSVVVEDAVVDDNELVDKNYKNWSDLEYIRLNYYV